MVCFNGLVAPRPKAPHEGKHDVFSLGFTTIPTTRQLKRTVKADHQEYLDTGNKMQQPSSDPTRQAVDRDEASMMLRDGSSAT